MRSPEPNVLPSGISCTNVIRPARFPPIWPMSHIALPRQLMPRAVHEDAPNRMERKALGRIVEGFGPDMGIPMGCQDARDDLCCAEDEDFRCGSTTASDGVG